MEQTQVEPAMYSAPTGTPALEKLLVETGVGQHFTGKATLAGDRNLIRSAHRLVEASGTARLLVGCAAAAIWEKRTGESHDVAIDTVDALHSLHTAHFVWQQGAFLEVGAEFLPTTGLFPTSDGRHVVFCAGPPYLKLLNGYLDFLGCANNREALVAATRKYTATELEEALAVVGVPACRVFDREEWLAHPQGQILAATPLIEIEKLADGEPVPFGQGGSHPLGGIRVLDFTHVLAGPHCTQELAEFGAEVLHITSPLHQDTLPQHLGVDMGKYCAYLDLADPEQRAKMGELACDADVFVNSYRPAVSERFHLTPRDIVDKSRSGVVVVSINAYGHAGPWRDRVGFDPNGQAASGFAATEGGGLSTPRQSPVGYLADTLTGALATAGVQAALLRRATEGGSYHVKLSLARTAMWVQELGLVEPDPELPAKDSYPYRSMTAQTTYGAVTTLANPIQFSGIEFPANHRLVPYGADPAEWPTASQ